MLKPAADAAQRLLRNTKVRSNITQCHPVNYMWRLLQQVLVTLSSRPELRIYKPLFQPYIILFISNAHQSFNFMIPVEQLPQRVFGDAP